MATYSSHKFDLEFLKVFLEVRVFTNFARGGHRFFQVERIPVGLIEVLYPFNYRYILVMREVVERGIYFF